MIRRVLVIGSIGLALAGGARVALHELTEHRWERRKAELLELALFPPAARRPWEVRFESLAERVRTSGRFDEIVDSPYRPHVAGGSGEPRSLDDFEKVWLESLWNELTGLDAVLEDLRVLPLDALAWHGEPQKLLLLRELTNGLCGRAWLALERGDDDATAEAYADALRLARATDDGTIIGAMIHSACDLIVLSSLRSALELGASPRALRAAVAPLLADWAYDASRAERAIRRDLAGLIEAVVGGEPDDPALALRQLAPIEEAIELAHAPVEALMRVRENKRAPDAPDHLWLWAQSAFHLHALHARRNVALTALAVAEFREEHACFPASLAELSQLPREHSLDPLTGAPLPYTMSAHGARIGPAEWGTRAEEWEDLDASPYVWTLR